MEGPDGDEGPRVGLIRSAIQSIRCGACEIDAVFMEARGPLPKAAIRGLHQRIKELRQTAESAESAFREWTVELAGGSSTAVRAEHDALRASFELEVANVQKCMVQIANEVKRRKVTKEADLDQNKAGEEAELPATKVPLPPPTSGDVEAPPVRAPARTTQERLTSHASLAGTLQQMASQEEEIVQGTAKRKGQVSEERTDMSNESAKIRGSGASLTTVTVKAMPLHLKCILGVAAVIVGYVFYCHAQFLVLKTSGALVHDLHNPGGAIAPGEEIELMTPAPPRRLR